MSKLTLVDIDTTISARRVVPLRPDRETQALLDHLERSPAPRMPRIQPPLDDSLLARLARWLRNLRLGGKV
jgi:hypothetical protein